MNSVDSDVCIFRDGVRPRYEDSYQLQVCTVFRSVKRLFRCCSCGGLADAWKNVTRGYRFIGGGMQ